MFDPCLVSHHARVFVVDDDAVGYKCRVDENSWTGANKRILESELANKRYMLQNIQDLDNWCEKAGVCCSHFLLGDRFHGVYYYYWLANM